MTEDLAPTALFEGQQQRVDALSIARGILFAEGELPEDAVSQITTLADWILTGQCYPARTAGIGPAEVVAGYADQSLYNQGWNDHRDGVLKAAGRMGDCPPVAWSREHPAAFEKTEGRHCGQAAPHDAHQYRYDLDFKPAWCAGI